MGEIENILRSVGVVIDGPNPWDPQINKELTTKEKLFSRILSGGSLAVGESFMDGWWTCEKLDELIFRVYRNPENFKAILRKNLLWDILKNKIFNLQNIKRAWQVGVEHYDIGNDLYDVMLDKTTKSYTCGYWKDAKNLDEAQVAKLDLVCRKLELKPGERVLEIGCGWGNFMRYAAKNYGVECVGLSVSKEQCKQGKELSKDLPVEFVLTDYRTYKSDKKFDKIVSIGMFEAVGQKNFRTFMQVANRNLKDDGLFLLHTIGADIEQKRNDPWIDKYIFPNGYLPSVSQIGSAIRGLFFMEDWHVFGPYYSLTLSAWWENFDKAFAKLKANNPKYDDRFYKMWKFYLKTMEGNFRARNMNLWQIVFSKKGKLGGYQSVR